MVLQDTSLGSFVDPVDLFTCSQVVGFILVFHELVVHGFAGILSYVVLVSLRDLCAVTEVELVGEVFYTQVAVVADVWLAVFAVLGGDEDNAIGTIDTIDGCGSGIFQNLYALDIIRTDVVERTA